MSALAWLKPVTLAATVVAAGCLLGPAPLQAQEVTVLRGRRRSRYHPIFPFRATTRTTSSVATHHPVMTTAIRIMGTTFRGALATSDAAFIAATSVIVASMPAFGAAASLIAASVPAACVPVSTAGVSMAGAGIADIRRFGIRRYSR